MGLVIPLLVLALLAGCQTTRTNAPAVTTAPDQAFVWHELLSPNAERSRLFLTQVFDWNLTTPEGGYSPIYDDAGRLVGGMVDTEEMGWSMDAGGWLLSIPTPDIEVTLQRVRERGGTVLQEPLSLPDRGEIALIRDPQGAVIEVVELLNATSPQPVNQKIWIWHELITSDPRQAAAWYANVFRLQLTSMADGDRQLLLKNGVEVATVSRNPFEERGNQWIPVVAVTDLNQVLEQVSQWGGRVALTHRPDNGNGRLALIQDPTGAAMLLQEQEVSP